MKELERQVKLLIERPGLDVIELGNQLATSVGQKIEETLAAEEQQFLERVMSEITKTASPQVDLTPITSEIN